MDRVKENSNIGNLSALKDKNTYHKLTQAPHIENKIIIYYSDIFINSEFLTHIKCSDFNNYRQKSQIVLCPFKRLI